MHPINFPSRARHGCCRRLPPAASALLAPALLEFLRPTSHNLARSRFYTVETLMVASAPGIHAVVAAPLLRVAIVLLISCLGSISVS